MSGLTDERAREVLVIVKARLGRSWKLQLGHMWLRADYPLLEDLAPELQQLRNSDLRARRIVTGRGQP